MKLVTYLARGINFLKGTLICTRDPQSRSRLEITHIPKGSQDTRVWWEIIPATYIYQPPCHDEDD